MKRTIKKQGNGEMFKIKRLFGTSSDIFNLNGHYLLLGCGGFEWLTLILGIIISISLKNAGFLVLGIMWVESFAFWLPFSSMFKNKKSQGMS